MARTLGVVLAAGRGARLSPHVPAYHKPILMHEGRTIVAQAVDHLLPYVDEVIVVVAPTNAHQIVQVTNHIADGIQYVVQPEAHGPGDALDRALKFADPDDKIIIVMGDNVLGQLDVKMVAEAITPGLAVGTGFVNTDEVHRFARLDPDARWVEGPLTERERLYFDEESVCRAWIGPLRLIAKQWFEFRDECFIGPERKLSPILSKAPVVLVECNTFDIGEPGALHNG